MEEGVSARRSDPESRADAIRRSLNSEEGGHADKVLLTNSPEEALKDADIAVTDTW